MFGWSGGEVNPTDPWEKTIIEGGTCPDLGPVPSRRRRRSLDHLTIEDRAKDNVVTRNTSRSGAAEPTLNLESIPNYGASLHTRHMPGSHMSSLAKRGAVYGPAFSIPAGEFFCPALDSEEGITCEQAYDALEKNNEGGVWTDLKRKREVLTPTSTIDENTIAAHLHAHQQRRHSHGGYAGGELLHRLDERAKNPKLVKACKQTRNIEKDFPRGGQLNGENWGWVNPKDCGDFDFGSPLTARAANTQYHTEHVLEAQMIDLFFEHLRATAPRPDDPDPSKPLGSKVSFCDYVDILWKVPAFVWPGKDTQGGVGTAWNPIEHVAAQFPSKTFKRNEFVTLESAINAPSKTGPWADKKPWGDDKWTKEMAKYSKARSIFHSLRATMGSRIYQSNQKIRTIMKDQTDRIGDVLDALDTTLLPSHPPAGYRAWTKQDLKTYWHRFMKAKYTLMQAKTNLLVNTWLPKMERQYASQAEKDRLKDAPGDTQAALDDKKERRDFIAAIEKFRTEWNALPAWNNPL